MSHATEKEKTTKKSPPPLLLEPPHKYQEEKAVPKDWGVQDSARQFNLFPEPRGLFKAGA